MAFPRKRRKMSSGEARQFFDNMYARGEAEKQAAAEAFLKTPAGELARQEFNRKQLEKLKGNPKRRTRKKAASHVSTGKRRVSGLTIVKRRPPLRKRSGVASKVTRAKRNPTLTHSSHISQHFVNSIIRDFDMKRYSLDELIEIHKKYKGKGGAVRNGIAEAAKQLAMNKGAKLIRK
jgi:hypothetical protein